MRSTDEVAGRAGVVAGRLKEAAGKAVGDPVLEQNGASQRAAGQARSAFGKARRRLGDAVTSLKRKTR